MSMERRGCVSAKSVRVNRETGRKRSSLRRPETERFEEHGWHEPYESRGSRTDLWGTGGEIPPVYPSGSNTLLALRADRERGATGNAAL